MIKITEHRLDWFFEQFSKKSIIVVGDLMLDRYVWGTVDRISPEAPVPVVEVTSETVRLGGAANVAHNLYSLGATPIPIGIVGNDYAGQNGLLFSITMFEDYFLENIKKLTALARNYGLKVMQHTCGAASELLPLFIEAGIDIIDPVQVTAKGMDPVVLKKRYGEDIVFHGGIDTQHVLPNLSPDEVYQHASDIMHTLGKEGGYIFAPSQILQKDIPVEKEPELKN